MTCSIALVLPLLLPWQLPLWKTLLLPLLFPCLVALDFVWKHKGFWINNLLRIVEGNKRSDSTIKLPWILKGNTSVSLTLVLPLLFPCQLDLETTRVTTALAWCWCYPSKSIAAMICWDNKRPFYNKMLLKMKLLLIILL